MTTHERFQRLYQHQEPDRVPIIDSPWGDTVERWQSEGMPTDDYRAFFDWDRVQHIGADYSPQYPERVLEKTPEYTITTSPWGVTMKRWAHATSTPEFLDYTVKDRETWAAAKERMTPSRDRVNWQRLKKHYPEWRRDDDWIIASGWFGFDVAHSWMMGTEPMLIAMMEDPEWCFDMYNAYLDMNIAMLDMIWDEGYAYHAFNWPDDMGYKSTQFFSLSIYREIIKPVQKRAIEWAHAKGLVTELHSCGKVDVFIPELIEIGLDGLNPMEVKAGMDPLAIKAAYGDKLTLRGGFNAVLWADADAIVAEIEAKLPQLMKGGGYVFASDHSIPASVSLDTMKRIMETFRRVGTY